MSAPQKAACLVGQARLVLLRLANGEEPTSPIRINALNLANALAELVGPIQSVAGE